MLNVVDRWRRPANTNATKN